MASYYRSKSAACVDDTLAQLRQTAASGRADPNTITGFLAELFRTSPQERERLLKAEPSDYMKSVDVISLYRAGLPDEAQKFAAANNLSSLSDRLRAARMPPLDAVTPSSTPADNDLLIGAYMASGNTAHIQRILDNYSGADDGMVSDGLRVGFMMSKFGPGLAPKGRDSVMIKVACTKYGCKADQTKFLRVMTLGTAIWSLQSLAAQDDGIKKTLSEFFSRDARLKNLFAAEQAAFGNYLTTIVLVSTFQKDRTGAAQDQTYDLMNKSASVYENLGSGKDAFEPFRNLKK
ncbi:hypothetical protein V1279_000493 [Bradyrhizobium sp. AZCC 1610]|uniref:hypothetical protein n=1 Tax=Bradyrhizobium sp. AZCC 1610 TaxID=3117020 RepID=UPI002FF0ED67